MRASYFNDYESYAVDNDGNRYEMRNDRIWYRNAKIFNDYCVVGKDFISNDYGFFPIIEMKFTKGTHKINLTTHHIKSEFTGITSLYLIEDDEKIFTGKLKNGEIHSYNFTIKRNKSFSLKFSIFNEDITNAVLRYVLEDETIDDIDVNENYFAFNQKVSLWTLNQTSQQIINRNLNVIDYGSEYRY